MGKKLVNRKSLGGTEIFLKCRVSCPFNVRDCRKFVYGKLVVM